MNYLSFYSLSKRHSTGMAFLTVLAMCGLVAWLVLVFNAKKLAPDIRESHLDGYALGVFLAASIGAVAFYFVKRAHVLIDDDENNAMAMYIKDPAYPTTLAIHYPYTLSKQWCHSKGPRPQDPKLKMLFVTLCGAQGEPIVTFTSSRGALMDPPHGYEYIDLLLDPAFLTVKKGTHADRLLYAPDRIYQTVKTEDIALIMDDYLITLAKRKRS